MTEVLATAVLPSTTGLAEDAVVNDFAFDVTTLDVTTATDIATWIEAFYNDLQTIPGTDYRVSDFISDAVSRASGVCHVLTYDISGHLDGSPHGSPLFDITFTLSGPATSGLVNFPLEVAVVNAIHADLTGLLEKEVNPTPPPAFIRPANRRKGRQFIGPLNVYSSDQTSGNIPRVNTSMRDCLAVASAGLVADSSDAWCVWSRTEEALFPVVGGWVDDAFDTVRKRGKAPAVRTMWP